jgi:hypothetical protein
MVMSEETPNNTLLHLNDYVYIYIYMVLQNDHQPTNIAFFQTDIEIFYNRRG